MSGRSFKRKRATKLGTQRTAKRFLVLSDGVVSLGVLASLEQDTVKVHRCARSLAKAPAEALGELIARLFPGRLAQVPALTLVHGQAQPAVVTLELDNAAQLPPARIAELLRWEVEALGSDLLEADQLGTLLVRLGILSEEARDDLLLELADAVPDGAARLRLGDLACQRGLLSRDDLEATLRMQDEQQQADARTQFGWHALSSAGPARWLTTVVGSPVFQPWTEATTRRALGVEQRRLKGVLPMAGCATIARPAAEMTEGLRVVVELHHAQLALFLLRDGVLEQALVRDCLSRVPVPDDIAALLSEADATPAMATTVLVLAPSRVALGEAYCQQHEKACLVVPQGPGLGDPSGGTVSPMEALVIDGALRSMAGETGLALIPGAPPPPPLMQRQTTRVAAALSLVALVVGAAEFRLEQRERNHGKTLAAAERRLKNQEALAKDSIDARKLVPERDRLRAERDAMQKQIELFESALLERRKLNEVFLDIVVDTVNPNILLDTIEETRWRTFEIVGLSRDQRSIDLYSEALSERLAEWGLRIEKNPSTLATSGALMGGYEFRFVIQDIPVVLTADPTTGTLVTR